MLRALLFASISLLNGYEDPSEISKRAKIIPQSNVTYHSLLTGEQLSSSDDDSIGDEITLTAPSITTTSTDDIAEEFACAGRDFYYDMVRFRLSKLEARQELFRRCNTVYIRAQAKGLIP
jgi:hypothetical protein